MIGYRKLVDQIEAVAATLPASGCAAGDVVACLGPRAARTPVLVLALESIGAVCLPVDTEWPPARITEVLDLSASAFLVDYTTEASPAVDG